MHPGRCAGQDSRETTKTKDITGGLPRVAELFRSQKAKEQAVISEIDGEVSNGGFVKGQRKVVVDNIWRYQRYLYRGAKSTCMKAIGVRAERR